MTAFGALFDRVRETSPLVHCISNLVSANDCANIVLAAAAVCAMGLCGETAAARLTGEEGTGTLRMYLMDAVSNLTGVQLDQGANDELYR